MIRSSIWREQKEKRSGLQPSMKNLVLPTGSSSIRILSDMNLKMKVSSDSLKHICRVSLQRQARNFEMFLTMKLLHLFFCIVFKPLLFAGTTVFCSFQFTPADGQVSVKQWEVYELTLTAEGKYRNPYAEIPVTDDGLVEATFTGIKGAAKGMTFTVYGFWDGGQTWKVRFAPPTPGIFLV